MRRRKHLCRQSRAPAAGQSRASVSPPAAGVIVVAGEAREIPNIEQFWHSQLDIPIISLHSDWFERASPRIILAAQQLCTALAQVK